MSVKLGLLALLAEEPMYGARLRAEFEARTGGTWPLNVGQVYTTLARLERDGLVEAVGRGCRGTHRLPPHPCRAGGGRPVVALAGRPGDHTSRRAGHQARPGRHGGGGRRAASRPDPADGDAAASAEPDAPEAAGHRTATPTRDLAWLLVLENLIYAAEAEVRWLDHVEARLAREAGRPRRRAAGIPATDTTDTQQHRTQGGNGHEQGTDPPAGQRHPRPRRRDRRGARARGGEPGGQRRRAGRGDGPERVRQVDPAQPRGRPRRPHERGGPHRGREHRQAQGGRHRPSFAAAASASSSRTSTSSRR